MLFPSTQKYPFGFINKKQQTKLDVFCLPIAELHITLHKTRHKTTHCTKGVKSEKMLTYFHKMRTNTRKDKREVCEVDIHFRIMNDDSSMADIALHRNCR